MKKIIALSLAICLSAALQTSLQAKIYDLTKKPTEMNQTWDEYKIKGNKSFSVKNNLNRQVYVRIGYKGPIGPVCEYTGFVLNPGQTGKILKSPICRPYIVSSGDTRIKQWSDDWIGNGLDRLGDFMWEVNHTWRNEIEFKGKWSTDSNGKRCWEFDMRTDYGLFGKSYCPKN